MCRLPEVAGFGRTDLYSQVMSVPLHRQLTQEFRRRIRSELWPLGSFLPSEAELCAEFGTSRGPVRQALAALRNEGLIAGDRGRPPVVRRAMPSQPFSTLMSFTQWAAGSGYAPGQRTVEIARRRATTLQAAELRVEVGEPVVELVRVRLLDAVPTMLERTTFVAEAGNLLFDFDTDSGSIFAYLRDRGVDLYHGQHTIDAIAADENDAVLLDIPVGSALLRERRCTSSRHGRPLEMSSDCYRPDMATFSIEKTVDELAPVSRIGILEAS